MSVTSVTASRAETDAQWAVATERVALYLRAHGLDSPEKISRLAADVVAIARTRERPGVEPLTLAMEIADESLLAWFAKVLPADEAGGAPLLARGRVALALGEIPARWPSYFMNSQAVPAELLRVMREADLGRSPEIKLSNMAPRLLAQPSTVLGRLRWQWSYRWPFLRIVSGVMVLLSLLGVTLSSGR